MPVLPDRGPFFIATTVKAEKFSKDGVTHRCMEILNMIVSLSCNVYICIYMCVFVCVFHFFT